MINGRMTLAPMVRERMEIPELASLGLLAYAYVQYYLLYWEVGFLTNMYLYSITS